MPATSLPTLNNSNIPQLPDILKNINNTGNIVFNGRNDTYLKPEASINFKKFSQFAVDDVKNKQAISKKRTIVYNSRNGIATEALQSQQPKSNS